MEVPFKDSWVSRERWSCIRKNPANIAFYVLQDKKWNKMADGEYICKFKIYIYISLQRARQNFPVKYLEKTIQNIYNVNDLINALGVYVILGVQARAFKRGRRFITVTISTKLMCFRRKYQESLKTAEYPLHQLIHLGRLEIHIRLWNPSINVRILAHCYCVVIVSLSLL